MASETKPSDPERIYLEPWPYSPEGRLWSAENIWPLELWPPEPDDESERATGVEYIRADLHATEISRLTRELEEARERERHIEGQIVALVEAEVISEGKAREILGIGVEEWREIEDSRALAKDMEVSDG